MSPDGLSRGVPVQDLPENQDPAVRYTLNEVTGEITPWPEEETPAPKKKAAAKKAAADVPADAVETGVASETASALSARELGS